MSITTAKRVGIALLIANELRGLVFVGAFLRAAGWL
jgi:hypothetical protein